MTVPLTINQTLRAKAFITARHLGDESVASGTGNWAISKWTERIIRTLTQRQAPCVCRGCLKATEGERFHGSNWDVSIA